MTKILITGGAGFIGSSLADGLIQNPKNEVVIIDNLLTGSVEKLPSKDYTNWQFIQCDVNEYDDLAAIMCSHNFEYVFHYAAMVGVQRTLKNPIKVLNDIQGIKNILQLCKNTGVKRVYFSSSSEVYGDSITFPLHEVHTPLNSRLPYAVVKNVGEAFCRSYQEEYGLEYTIFRFFNTYGIKQSTDFVVSLFIKSALHNQPITIHGDGIQSRTFCYINDNIDTALNTFYNNQFINNTINIGNTTETSILELAKLIIEISGSKSEIVHIPPRKEGEMQRRVPSNELMLQVLNRPLMPLKQGLEKLIFSGKF